MLSARHRADAAVPHAYRALDALHAGRHRLRRMVAINLATILRTQGDVEASRAVLAAAEASAQAASDLDALVLQMEQQFRHGQLIHAARSARHVLQMTEQPEWQKQPLARLQAHLFLGQIFYQWNELDKAEAHLTNLLQMSQRLGILISEMAAFLYLALVAQARVDGENAQTQLQKGQTLAAQFEMPRVAEETTALGAHLAMMAGVWPRPSAGASSTAQKLKRWRPPTTMVHRLRARACKSGAAKQPKRYRCWSA